MRRVVAVLAVAFVAMASCGGGRAADPPGIQDGKPSDVNLAMLYDSFTITVMLLLEDLGFCDKGEGGAFVREHLRVGGPLPINTDGGGLSAVHPGMRGMFLMTEAVRQIRGEGAPLAIARDGGVDTCLVHGVGGQLSSHATLIVGKES